MAGNLKQAPMNRQVFDQSGWIQKRPSYALPLFTCSLVSPIISSVVMLLYAGHNPIYPDPSVHGFIFIRTPHDIRSRIKLIRKQMHNLTGDILVEFLPGSDENDATCSTAVINIT